MSPERQAVMGFLLTVLAALLAWLGKQIWGKVREWNSKVSPTELAQAKIDITTKVDREMALMQKQINGIEGRYSNDTIDQKFALRDQKIETMGEKIDDLKETMNSRLDDLPDHVADKLEARLNKRNR